MLLKVMAGDQLSATTKYYYQNAVTNGTGDNLTAPIVTALIQSILGSPATGLAKGNSTNISNQLNADALFKTKTAPDANNASGSNPKAYMTIVFFDERFLAGLPNTNDGSNIVEGFVKWSDIDKVRPSLPLDGNSGGLT